MFLPRTLPKALSAVPCVSYGLQAVLRVAGILVLCWVTFGSNMRRGLASPRRHEVTISAHLRSILATGTGGLGHVALFTIWIFWKMSGHVVRACWLGVAWPLPSPLINGGRFFHSCPSEELPPATRGWFLDEALNGCSNPAKS